MTYPRSASVENSIFEVSLAQAISALRRAVGSDDLADVSLTRAEPLTGEQNGYCSRGLIATFAGQAQGRPWERTLFVKRHHWDHYQEEMHYERLARLGFPIVHLYGRVTSSGGTEVLFLEYLNRAGIDVAAAEQISELFRLHARLNALGVPEAYREDVEALDAEQLVQAWTAGVDELRRQGCAGHLGPELADACHTHSRDAMLAHVEATAAAVAGIPQALSHGEAGPSNCGWRGEELVLFDLHKVGPAPRFRDVAGLLAAVKGSTMPGLPWDRAVSVYLAEYNRIAGGPVMREQFVWETEALHRHNAYGGLPWSIRIALGARSTSATRDQRSIARDCSWRLLTSFEVEPITIGGP